MARLWAICAALLTLAIAIQSLSFSTALPVFNGSASAQSFTCFGQGVSANPSTVNTPGQVTITADGFAPGATVSITITPPPGWSFSAQAQPTADGNCRAVSAIQIGSCATCPSGTATVRASGIAAGGSPVTYQNTFFINSGGTGMTGHTPTPSSIPAPPTCTLPGAAASPAVIRQGEQTTFIANGFAPQAPVTIQISGPGQPATVSATANSFCQIVVPVTFQFTDPPGLWTFTATGQPYFTPGNFAPQFLQTQTATVQVQPGATPTVPGPAVTSTTVCPLPSITMGASVVSGQQGTYNAVGFRPGATVQVRLQDPSGAPAAFFADNQIGPATSNCSVFGTLVAIPTVSLGRYRLTLSGPNHLGSIVSPFWDFDVVSGQGQPPATSTPGAPIVELSPTATPSTTGPVPTAPVAIEQSIAIVGGAQVPQVGQTSVYGHVIRVTNTSPTALDAGALGALLELLAASLQGQGINMSFTTDYAEGSRVTAATANVGNATVRGSSVTWNGQLQSGQSLELRTTVEQTPATALALNQPIRGQTFSVSDVRGTTLALAAPPPVPQLPPAQRVVQPPPPPVDPITGPRFFATTGFGIGDDSMWTYYVRRGGFKTFGAPISRQFLLSGTQAQLFEKGMLAFDANNNVVSVNLLEAPFLPYETLDDLRLPAMDSTMLASFPDPSRPTFPDEVQEYVRVNSAENFDQKSTRFYATFLGTVLYSDAFFLGPGDPNLLPGFNLEIWGAPISPPSYQVTGYELVPGGGPNGEDITRPILDSNVVLQRFQRGVMRYDNTSGATSGAAVGPYLRAVLMGQVTDPEFAGAASASPLWAQYNSDGDPATWLDRPDDLPDTNLALAFEPQTE